GEYEKKARRGKEGLGWFGQRSSQKLIFAPSCKTRIGSPRALTFAELAKAALTQQVCPKAVLTMLGEPEVALRGFSKFAWLKTLNASKRSCRLKRSVILMFFDRPASKFQKCGPCARFRPLPTWPGGGMQKKVCVPMTLMELKCGSAGFVMRGPVLNITGPCTFGLDDVTRVPPGLKGPSIRAELWWVLLVVSSPLLRV